MKKLQDVNNSSQSIQTLSLWLIHHRKHHVQIVKIWLRELLKSEHDDVPGKLTLTTFLISAKDSKKLTFMYLANDVIQNSKKKGPEFGKEFGTALSKAFQHMSTIGYDDKTKNSLVRLLNIWGERGVYDELQIAEFKQSFRNITSHSHKQPQHSQTVLFQLFRKKKLHRQRSPGTTATR